MLTEELRELEDLPAAAKALGETREVRAEEEGVILADEGSLMPLLEARVELLNLLEPILERRVKTLEQRELALQEHLDATRAMRQLLDRYLLWTPSHGPIDSTWLERAPEGLSDLFKASRWATTFRLTKKELASRPVLWLSCFLLLAALVELRRRAPQQIRSRAEIARRTDADRFGDTAFVFGWTLLAALPLPALFLALGELLQSVGNAGRYSDSVGRALMALVVPLIAAQTMRWTAVDDGLADAHFGWTSTRRRALRRALSRATLILIPMYYVISLSFIRNLELPNDVQARVAVVASCLVLAWAFWRLLDIGEAWRRHGSDESTPSKLRRLLRGALPSSTLVIAALSLTGYVYTAGLLLTALLMSICLVIAVSLGVGLLSRSFLIGERRLEQRRAEQQQAAAHADGPEVASATAEAIGDAEAADLSLEQVNAQTQRLLMVLRVSLLFFGLLWVWAEVLPAITRLDEIPLWTFSDVDPEGMPISRPVTLMGALFGLVALTLTIVGSRNLPGLVELGLLSQTSIDAASRYAITSILRYAIVIVGTIVGLEMLGMRWSQLQWLAAALTVGLGFGLQEIFANFVSGLILLFERPFRVGDVITVDTLTGRVTRIRTRATTILDFDNREIVVPNKNFITGQLLNWTLSDTSTRISVKVGVAYGTDPDLVHRLLLEVAFANPLIQRDPEPCSWFLAFGASSLDFELRFFVSAVTDRLKVQSEVHREIARSFAEHDIEIAFPQMDLHVRDLPEGQTLARAT
jgi:potassium efflux system protein